MLEFLLTSCNAHFHKFYFTFPCITLLIEHSPNSQRPAKAIFSLRLYKSILSDLQFQKTMSRLCFFSINFISSSLYLPSLSIRLFLIFCFAFACSKCFATSIASLTLFSPKNSYNPIHIICHIQQSYILFLYNRYFLSQPFYTIFKIHISIG